MTTERELALVERAQKAEKNEEEMRSERLIAIDEIKTLKTKIMELEVVVSQKNLEIDTLKLSP